MTFAAYLRVYVPAGEGPVEAPPPGTAARVLGRGAYGVWFESRREDAFFVNHRGRRYACPRYPRLRMLEGLLAFRNAYPAPVGECLVPEGLARRAAAELDHIRSRHPEARSHILTSPFHVPPRWFAAFDPKERQVVPESGGPAIRYRTARHSALRRLEQAVRILEGAGFDESTIDQVHDLIDWLRGFPGDALVELDYGGAARLFSEGELAADETAADVAAALGALARGDFEEAGECYSRVAARWSHARSLTFAS